MKKTGRLFKLLLYISVPFIIYFLYKLDFLRLKGIEINYLWLTIALLLLWVGFLVSALSWKYALHLHTINISEKKAVVSHGLSVFAKYIPGKIWVILGRAAYVSQDKFPLEDTSFISLKEQLIFILLGFMISLIPSISYFGFNYITWILLVTIIGFALVIFNPQIHTLTEKIFSFLFKRDFVFPRISFVLAGKLSGVILLYWLLWTVGFYFLLKALISQIPLVGAFAFPLSACYGLIAIVMPGGLGIRESIMAAYLTQMGMAPSMAITISIASRVWFMTGELFIFIVAFVGKRSSSFDVLKN